jgi:hypothetical protein
MKKSGSAATSDIPDLLTEESKKIAPARDRSARAAAIGRSRSVAAPLIRKILLRDFGSWSCQESGKLL